MAQAAEFVVEYWMMEHVDQNEIKKQGYGLVKDMGF